MHGSPHPVPSIGKGRKGCNSSAKVGSNFPLLRCHAQPQSKYIMSSQSIQGILPMCGWESGCGMGVGNGDGVGGGGKRIQKNADNEGLHPVPRSKGQQLPTRRVSTELGDLSHSERPAWPCSGPPPSLMQLPRSCHTSGSPRPSLQRILHLTAHGSVLQGTPGRS